MEPLIFISSALQQPRHQKRIDLLSNKYNLKVLYFFRNKYTENYKNYTHQAVMIGKVRDGRYLSRIYLLIKLFFILLNSNINKVYCTSPDQVFISLLARKKVFFEVGDLYQVDSNNKFYQYLDAYIIPRVSGIILTSRNFYTGYFYKFDKHLNDKTVVVENKLLPGFESAIQDYRNNFNYNLPKGLIKISVIGNLAFKKSLIMINDFMLKNKGFELHIYGDGLVDIFKNTPNCFYHGRFKSPEDLQKIYSNIDINIILYDYENNNVKLALPNKLYESIAFLKPIVCASDVALSEYVLKNKIGTTVSNGNLKIAIDEILNNYSFYIDRLIEMPKKSYLCYEQHEILNLLDYSGKV